MTEAEWLACGDPARMLAFLRGRASDRKLRLFACACCRQSWAEMTDERSRRAVELGELFADAEVAEQEMVSAGHGAWRLTEGVHWDDCKPQVMAWVACTYHIADAVVNNHSLLPGPVSL